MTSRNSLAIGAVAGSCILGTVYAILVGSQITVALSSGRLTTELFFPPNLPKLFTVAFLSVLLMGLLGVAGRRTMNSASPQANMVSQWSPLAVLLWTMCWGWAMLVYHPIPFAAHHIDKILLALTSVLVWSLLYVLAPARLANFLETRAFYWFRVAALNALVFIVIGEAAFRLADPWLARRGPFGGKQTPSFLTPHAPVEGSIRFSNSLGFRDVERSPENITSNPRIIAIGDSFTYGAGVSYDEVFVTLLERALQESIPGTEIFNMGVPGWGPHEEFELIKGTAIHYKPDLVLLNVFVGNDIIPDGHFEPPMFVAGQRYVVHGSGNWIHDHLEPQRWYLYHHFQYLRRIGPMRFEQMTTGAGRQLVWRRPMREACMLYWKADSRSFDSYWGQAREALESIVRFLGAQGVHVIMVLHPDGDQLYHPQLPCGRSTTMEQYDFERPQRLLREWSATHGISTIDLLPVFQRVPQPDDLYLVRRGDTHYSVEGHRLAAMTMLPILHDWMARLSAHPT